MNWKDVTIKQYKAIEELRDCLTDDMNEIDNLNLNIALCAILTDKDVEEIERMDMDDFGDLLRETQFMKTPLVNVPIKNTYTINGKKYKLNTNINNFTVSQYIDFQTLLKEGSGDMVKLLAIYLIPLGKEYGEYDFEEVYKDIESMSIEDGHSICFFFQLQYATLMRSSLIYSKRKMKRMMKRETDKEKKKLMKVAIEELERSLEMFGDGGIS